MENRRFFRYRIGENWYVHRIDES